MFGKLAIFFLAIVVAIVMIWVWSYSEKVDDLTKTLSELKSSVDVVSRQIGVQNDLLHLKTRGGELNDLLKSRTAERDRLKEEIAILETQGPKLDEAMVQAILQVRERSIGMTFPELTLATGRALRNVNVQKVAEDTVTLHHAEGVVSAKAEDLPAALRDRFRLGEAAPKSAPKSAEDMAAAKYAAEMTAFQEDLKKHQDKVLEMRLSLEQLTNSLRAASTQVSDAAQAVSSATSASQKFYARNRHEQAKAQVAAIQRSYDNKKIELQRLEAKAPREPVRE